MLAPNLHLQRSDTIRRMNTKTLAELPSTLTGGALQDQERMLALNQSVRAAILGEAVVACKALDIDDFIAGTADAGYSEGVRDCLKAICALISSAA